MFFELIARNSKRSRKENGLFFTTLLVSIVAFYIILSLSRQDVMLFLQKMESDAVNRLLAMIPVFLCADAGRPVLPDLLCQQVPAGKAQA